jgi:hypothetical protein
MMMKGSMKNIGMAQSPVALSTLRRAARFRAGFRMHARTGPATPNDLPRAALAPARAG